MRTKTLITVKTDKKLKEEAQRIATQIGIPLGTFINATLRQFVRQKEITLSIVPLPSAYLLKVLRVAHSDYDHGKVSKPIKNITKLKKSLNS